MKQIKCEVLVAGAGPAGIAAAIAAARSGADVILVERYGCVGGGLTSLYVRPISGDVENINIGQEINKRIENRTDIMSSIEAAKTVLPEMLCEAGVKVYLQTQINSVETLDGRIIKVVANSHSCVIEFIAEQYIDATGDGDVAALAGAQIKIGRESDLLVQPVSIMFTIEGIEPDYGLLCHHEEHYTQLPNGEEYLDLCHKACASGELPPSVNIVRLYGTGKNGERMVNATQMNKVDPLDPNAVFKAEVELRRQVVQCTDFLRRNIPGFENIRVNGSCTTLGVRESRRVIGDYILTGEDLIEGRKFDDAIAHNVCFAIDIHNPDGAGQSETDGLPHLAMPYDIPYRALTPLGLSNLLTAGRCISGDHRAHSSYRVMKICMAIGHAAGFAAVLALKTGDTRKIDIAELQAACNCEREVK